MLPDLDAVPGLLTGDMGRFHNSWTHSLMVGVIVALAGGAAAWLWQRSGFLRWFSVALLSYELHVIMDFFTIGRGVMVLWPFTANRYEPPVKLFLGLRWSHGLLSIDHLWTIGTELIFAAFILIMGAFLRERLTPNDGRRSQAGKPITAVPAADQPNRPAHELGSRAGKDAD